MNRSSVCSAAMLAVGITATASTASAATYEFTTNYTVHDRDATIGAGTAGSFAAATMMGAHGFSHYAIPSDWQNKVITKCQNKSSSSTLWPSQCTPNGMATAVNNMTGDHWVTDVYNHKAPALNMIVNGLALWGSPAVVPIYGQADHWVTVDFANATYNGNYTWTINQVKFYDGGPVGQADSGGNLYLSGHVTTTGSVWKGTYFKVITAINSSCDPNCTSDPYYDKYITMIEPPLGSSANAVAIFARAPGILTAGQHMSTQIASMRVWDSLIANHMDQDAEVWSSLQGGVPGAAWEVHGLWPSGAQWDYYLVPILSDTTTAIAFVQMAADDGSFESVYSLDQPVSFVPISLQVAEQMARGTLSQGEHLTGGLLTWDPRGDAPLEKSPVTPYYEFGIMGPGNQDAGMVYVSLNGGAEVVRSE